MYKGIDVSQWQGAIDWKKVAAAGIEFAIIRCVKGNLSIDPYFEANYEGARTNGIKVGAYKYSYATTVEDAEAEAWAVVKALRGKQFEAKVWLDLEDNCQKDLDKELLYQIAQTFLEIVSAAGFEVGIYCNQYWYNSILTSKIKKLTENFWIAKWSSVKPELGELAWQYSSSGSVSGIKGRVDMNYYYGEFDKTIVADEPEDNKKTVEELAQEVINGRWGNGSARKKALEAAGYDYETVQKRVNAILDGVIDEEQSTSKSVDELAEEVINGRWGNGAARKQALEAAGYDYTVVQTRVNELCGFTASPSKPLDEVVKEVIQGRWGNGKARKEALEKAGYDYEEVQKLVNIACN